MLMEVKSQYMHLPLRKPQLIIILGTLNKTKTIQQSYNYKRVSVHLQLEYYYSSNFNDIDDLDDLIVNR